MNSVKNYFPSGLFSFREKLLLFVYSNRRAYKLRMPLTIHLKTMKSPLVQMDWSTNTKLKIGKKKNNNNNNNEGRGTCQNLITVQCFSTKRFYSTCLFLGNTIYCYLLKTVILPHGSIPRVSHMQTLRHPRLRFLYMVCWCQVKRRHYIIFIMGIPSQSSEACKINFH